LAAGACCFDEYSRLPRGVQLNLSGTATVLTRFALHQALDLCPVDIEAGIMQNFSSAIPVKKIASNRQ
jgi:hypothetical protein